MKLNYFEKQMSTVGRWLTTALLCVATIALIWQGAFLPNSDALAAPSGVLIAADAGDQVKSKVSEGAGQAKGFIDDTKEKVQRTAKKNAAKVDNATDGGSFVERKAKKDAARILKRSEEDAARTKKAVDNSKNAVKGVVDKIKEAF